MLSASRGDAFRVLKRLLIFVSVLLLGLLTAEGGLSLSGSRGLRDRWIDLRRSHPGAALAPVDGGTTAPGGDGHDGVGLYVPHEDPLVGYVLRPDSEVRILACRIRTDALGLRARPGEPAPPDALRLVVLGDSVAFGIGVADHETLAARLEAHLAAMRGPGERAVACRTVAVPSWNHRAAAAFLLDHWDELDADVVLYLPIENDVFDIDGVGMDGRRRVAPDPSSPDPWLAVSVRQMVHAEARKFVRPHGELSWSELGSNALYGDVCRSSRARHDENARTIVRLHGFLAQQGARLLVVWHELSDYTWSITSRLATIGPEIPSSALLRDFPREFTLGDDPHPNATTLDVWAGWLASDLQRRGWLGAGEAVAEVHVPEEYEARRAEMPPPDVCESLAAEARRRASAALRPEIDFRTGRGLLQVFGGLNSDGTARTRLQAILAPAGRAIEVEVGGLRDRPDLYPLAIAVEVDERRVGKLVVSSGMRASGRFALPTDLQPAGPLEVRLVAERSVVFRQSQGARQIVSFRPLRLACVESR